MKYSIITAIQSANGEFQMPNFESLIVRHSKFESASSPRLLPALNLMKTSFIFLLVLAATASFGADALNTRLQQALYEEEANQNLDAAIQAYQSILKTHEDERRLAATARFRLGECFRKLGRTNEAAIQYQQVVRDFSGQTNLVRLSEQNLYALGRSSDAGPAPTTALPRPNPRERPFIEAEIAMTEKELATIKANIAAAVQAPDAEIPKRQALSRLYRELASIDDPGGAEVKRRLEEEIALQEKLARRGQELIRNGLAGVGSDFEEQKTLLALRRELVRLESRPASIKPNQAGNKSGAEGASPNANTVFSAEALENIEIKRLEKVVKESPDLINGALQQALLNHQQRVVTFLLDHGADVNQYDSAGQCPLHLAAGFGDRAMVELLIERKANVNAINRQKETALLIATTYGFKSIVELLIDNGSDISAVDKNGRTALHIAIADDRKEIAEALVARNASLTARAVDLTPLDLAVSRGNIAIATLLMNRGAEVDLKDSIGKTALVRAISVQSDKLVDLLLTHHADPNTRFASEFDAAPDQPKPDQLNQMPTVKGTQFTPIMWAANIGATSIIQRLIQAGADVNALDSQDATALLWAIRRDRMDAVEMLLAAHAEANRVTRSGDTALGTAAKFGRGAMVRLLLDHGANPNVVTPDPPLHWAVRYRHKAAIEQLLDRGADVEATDSNGQTVLDLTKNNQRTWQTPERGNLSPTIQNPELLKLLRQHGASEYTPRPGLITLCRISRGYSQAFLFKGTNDYNNHTLLELIVMVYGDPGAGISPNLAFPDFSNIRINRRDTGSKQPREIKADLNTVLSSNDVPLEWGDVVEIPELDHRANEAWSGLAGPNIEAINRILSRKVEIRIKGETYPLVLTPPWNNPRGFGGMPRPINSSIPGNIAPPPSPGPTAPVAKTLSGFRLRNVLFGSNVLRVSSDLSRVKVKRTVPKTKQTREFVFDLTVYPANYELTDLWLLDGDVIEVPD